MRLNGFAHVTSITVAWRNCSFHAAILARPEFGEAAADGVSGGPRCTLGHRHLSAHQQHAARPGCGVFVRALKARIADQPTAAERGHLRAVGHAVGGCVDDEIAAHRVLERRVIVAHHRRVHRARDGEHGGHVGIVFCDHAATSVAFCPAVRAVHVASVSRALSMSCASSASWLGVRAVISTCNPLGSYM